MSAPAQTPQGSYIAVLDALHDCSLGPIGNCSSRLSAKFVHARRCQRLRLFPKHLPPRETSPCIVFDTVSFVDSRISGLSRSRRTRSRGFYVVGVRAVTGVAWGVDQFVCR